MKKISFLYIVIASVLWGTSGIFFNILEPYGFTPLQMTAMRGTVAAVTMCVFVLFYNRKLFKVKIKELIIFAASGLCVFGTASCYFSSINEASVSTAVILMYTAPIFVVVYSVLFLGEKLNLPKIISIILVILGCALVSGVIGGMEFSAMGIVFGLASGICYSAYNILTRVEMMHGCNSVSATLYSFIFMGMAALAASKPAAMLPIIAAEPVKMILLIIAIGICTCVLPYFFYTLALRDIPAGTASAMGIIEPMAATLFSVIFFDEKLSIFSAVGIVLILAAVVMLGRNESKNAHGLRHAAADDKSIGS